MLQICRGSRVEVLAELLAARLHRLRPASVLAAQTVLVGHPGMKRWLTAFLAELPLPGLPRIAANIDFLLPGEWLDGLSQAVLGNTGVILAPYRRPALRWHIHALLGEIDDAEVAAYLQGEDAPRRRFQLADRLAGLYTQYLVYRRDWLSRWEAGKPAGEDFPLGDHWQGELWRRLVARLGPQHRGKRMGDLLARLPGLPADPDQPALHVFGHSHLPGDVLLALRQLARSREVIIYFPDPCRELWEDLRSDRDRYKADDDALVELEQPLLAALGRLGQHHALLLNGLDAEIEHRDLADSEASASGSRPLLQCLQDSIRTLQAGWPAAPVEALREDASLRVHSCHTRLRELEVLKDALLDQLDRDPQLQPRQIVVMAPDMAAYVPLIPAVFGPPGRYGSELPYHLADLSLGRSHPLLTAFGQLLDLTSQRISRSQLLALLALPAVMRRLGLDAAQLQAIERWLARSQVAWSLDGAMKSEFGAAEVAANSFAFGFDRMAAGHLLGREGPDQLLGDILPADPVHGPDAQGLAALWTLLELLRDWREQCRQPRPLAAWAERLQRWIAALFLADWQDVAEQSALTALERAIASLASEGEQAGSDLVVEWSVIQEALRQALAAVPERQPFLAGGISFCGLVPQRAIPFAVVAILGLNDGEYPRGGGDAGLDLMQRHPRRGDRGSRSEDRYLFLEALMSARQALHLSWVGQGVVDGKPRNPALPLAELLRQLDRVHGCPADPSQPDRPWLLRHALQPFDGRYFDPAQPDPRWFSYSPEFAATEPADSAEPWSFRGDTIAAADPAEQGRVELATLCAFYARPAPWVCKQALGLAREALQAHDDGGDREPLTCDRGLGDDTPVRLLWEALAGDGEIPAQPPERLRCSGQLAAGWMGEQAYAELRDQGQVLLDGVRKLAPFASGQPRAVPQLIDLPIGGRRLIGQLDQVYQADDGLWLVQVVNSPNVDFGKLLPLYLRWAALRLARPDTDCRVALLRLSRKKDKLEAHPWVDGFPTEPEQLRAGLEGLLGEFQLAGQTANAYFPRSSLAAAEVLVKAAQGKGGDPLEAAWKQWVNDYSGSAESDYAPGYNRLLAGEAHFLDRRHPASRAFLARAARYLHWLGVIDDGKGDSESPA